MSFDSDEKSVAGSRVAELYEFTTATAIYRYTSAADSITYAGNVYTPAPLRRSHIQMAGMSDPPSFTVVTLATLQFVVDQRATIPSQGINFTLRRLQRVSGVATVLRKGKVMLFKRQGDIVTIEIPSLLDLALAVRVPSLQFQANCNNQLGDAVCTIDRTLFRVVTTVTSVTDALNFVAGSDGGKPSDWFLGGEVVHVLSGERRAITDRNPATLSFQVKDALPPMGVGDSIQLYAGCRKRASTDCRDKFNNVSNFTGFPMIPSGNPYRGQF